MRLAQALVRLILCLTPPICLLSAQCPAQGFRTTAFSGRFDELEHEFTRVLGVFELRDGRVVVVDQGDATIHLGDFQARSVRQLGRRGAGPREYRSPSLLYRLGGDSAAVLDEAASRLLVISRNGSLGGFLSPRSLGTRSGRTIAASAGDGRGWLLGLGSAILTKPDGSAALVDSVPLFRWPVAEPQQVELVGYLRRPLPPGAGISDNAVVVRPGNPGPALATIPRWAVDDEGTVAFIDQSPYRVTYVRISGGRVEGPQLPYERIAVNDSIKRAFLSERALAQVQVVDGTGATRTERVNRAPRAPTSWVNELPPFRNNALIAFDDGGTLWIQRTTFGREGGRYDLVGTDGTLVDRVQLPEGHRIVGFGRKHVYTVRRDEDDLEYLQRRPMPGRVR